MWRHIRILRNTAFGAGHFPIDDRRNCFRCFHWQFRRTFRQTRLWLSYWAYYPVSWVNPFQKIQWRGEQNQTTLPTHYRLFIYVPWKLSAKSLYDCSVPVAGGRSWRSISVKRCFQWQSGFAGTLQNNQILIRYCEMVIRDYENERRSRNGFSMWQGTSIHPSIHRSDSRKQKSGSY